MIEVLILGSLFVWRLSSLLTRPTDSGPYEIFAKLRDLTGIKYGETGACLHHPLNPLCCLWCTSIWIAILPTLYAINHYNYGLIEFMLLWLSMSAGAILIESVISR